ncbi:solute carrier family 28 member 3-like [Equus quagga]|uniref:solute carrier family 28 member 3-like n=1 Tax=Equus quagga TaxID=89248 RepID=UPI001EE35462|nr:solute carrier family 28 member 3-like [Equus quagga]
MSSTESVELENTTALAPQGCSNPGYQRWAEGVHETSGRETQEAPVFKEQEDRTFLGSLVSLMVLLQEGTFAFAGGRNEAQNLRRHLRVIWSSLILGVVLWLIFDTAKLGQQQLVSFGGLIMLVILMFLFSKHPTKVHWRPVFGGIGLQFLLGLIILRTGPGFMVFQWLGKQVQTFLEHTDVGTSFVFGENYTDHYLAFKVKPNPFLWIPANGVFFGAVMSMLYYIGLMQWIIRKLRDQKGWIGWLMLVTMGSSPIESVVAAGSIFIGYTESPLLVRPYIRHATKSELHAIVTTGVATMAGNVLGIYISFGISPTHLLAASLMSAPASLAVAKLFWPETETPKTTIKDAMKMEMGDSRNLLEAASRGASSSMSLVANVAVNLIALVALLSFVNAVLSWFGSMFDYPQLSFEMICSYIFMPLSFIMGVEWQDSFMVSKLIGYKTFFTEFVAYERLSILVDLRKEAGPKFVNGVQQYMLIRSETIATYALCGFANFTSLVIAIKTLAIMLIFRRDDVSAVAVRALIAGIISSFMMGCIAGILSSTPVDINCHHILENAFASSLPQNTTDVLSCCQSLLSSLKQEKERPLLDVSLSKEAPAGKPGLRAGVGGNGSIRGEVEDNRCGYSPVASPHSLTGGHLPPQKK